MISTDFSSFPPFHEKKPRQGLRLSLRRLHVFRVILMRGKDLTPSYIMEMKTDVTKQVKMTSL